MFVSNLMGRVWQISVHLLEARVPGLGRRGRVVLVQREARVQPREEREDDAVAGAERQALEPALLEEGLVRR